METLKSLKNEVGPQPERTDRTPAFDVARIEPSGEAVIAGRATPGATVELLRGGVAHDRTVADPSGDFVFVPQPLPRGDYDLTLRATQPDGKVSDSKDSVAVALDSNGEEKPVVALVAPDKPAVVLSKPDTDAALALAIDAVEGEAGGRLYVSGRSAPGTKVRLYLNDAYIASATASAEGRLAFSIRSGIKPGSYRVRLDQVDESGRVQARAEVPFNAPVTIATPASPESQAPRSVAAAPKMATEPASSNSSPAPGTPAASSPAKTRPAPPPPSNSARGADAPAPPAIPKREASQAPGAPAAPQTAPAPADDTKNASVGRPLQPPAPASAESRPSAPGDTTRPPPDAPDNRKDVVIVPRVETTVVTRGDNLWNISRSTYGRGVRYTVIYNANRDQIRDPDLIYPGQIFVLPKDQPEE